METRGRRLSEPKHARARWRRLMLFTIVAALGIGVAGEVVAEKRWSARREQAAGVRQPRMHPAWNGWARRANFGARGDQHRAQQHDAIGRQAPDAIRGRNAPEPARGFVGREHNTTDRPSAFAAREHDALARGNFARWRGHNAGGHSAFGRPRSMPWAHRAGLLRNAGMRHWPLPGEAGFTGVPPIGETRFISNEMVVQLGSDASAQTLDTIAHRPGLSIVGTQNFTLGGQKLYRIRITNGRSVADVIHDLEAEKIPVVAQPNYRFTLQQDAATPVPSASSSPAQYVVGKLRLPEVHRIATGKNVTVAVIDSEVDSKHPDLIGSVADQFEAFPGDVKPHAHGTGMAGAIASHRRLLGVAPQARLLAVHAFSPDVKGGEATTESILMGLDWATRNGARIINMSFAGPRDPMLQLALKTASEKGILVVAAAGNAGPKSPPLFPAADPNVVAVTATDMNDALFERANRGSYIALAAPGVDVLEPAPAGKYQITTGTSVAAAHVSGVLALLLERKPAADAKEIREALLSTAKDLGPDGRDDQFGWGLVDPYRALLALDAKAISAR